jgi:Pentapeptide repeats (8 copies)
MPLMSLKQALELSPEEQSTLGDVVEKIKDVAEFFNDAFEALDGSPVLESLEKALPWIVEVADSSGLPFVKFAGSFLGKLLQQKDPEVLGRLACTLAYERAAVQAVKRVGEPGIKLNSLSIRKGMKDFVPSRVVDFKTLSLSNVLSHPFVREADRALLHYAERVGYAGTQCTRLQTAAHQLFVGNLRLVLSDGETAEKFQPFRRLVSMGTVGQSPFAALENHQEYQRRLFQRAPLFNTEPFALDHIYVDTDCSLLQWGDIRSGRKDPFDTHLPRRPLLSTVMDLITDHRLDDAIVIQGVAGAGKSSFTLRLCVELMDRGFHPIRIRLRDVPLDMNLAEALPRAVLLHEAGLPLTERGSQAQDDLFLGGNLFRESVAQGGFNICPWVLILDGWDEISLSASEGFRLQVTRMLRELRQEYLKNRSPVIRVVITGRPSVDVTESHFLLQSTPVLTIRALAPAQLNLLMSRLVAAVETAPLSVGSAETRIFANQDSLGKVRESYESCFKDGEKISGSMEIFSLPLLAHLAMRLVSVAQRPIGELLQNSTHLYRNLVDEIAWRRGRLGEGAAALVDEIGPDFSLRGRLRETAAAVTVFGKENIPARELAIRLGFKPRELETWAQDSTRTHFLTQLLINFFFKGGNEKLGCEFLHKSFREYLFAEYIVEVLKSFGRLQAEAWPERRESEYWKDFPRDTHLWKLSRSLGDCLSAQWMSNEVSRHVWALLEWEIERSNSHSARAPRRLEASPHSTEPLSFERWELVRDALADLWDWWGEGVHLRRPVGEDERGAVFGSAYVDGLVVNSAPRDPEVQQAGMMTVRTTTLDGHLGDAIFRLNVTVHSEIARRRRWPDSFDNTPEGWAVQRWNGVSDPGAGPRRYQSSISQGTQQWIVFAPAGGRPEYFEYFANRINSAGWRESFPCDMRLTGVDLRNAVLNVSGGMLIFDGCNLSRARIAAGCAVAARTVAQGMVFSNSGTGFLGGLFVTLCDLEGATLFVRSNGLRSQFTSQFENCNLRGVKFGYADLGGASFVNSPTDGASFKGAHLEGAQFDEISRPRDAGR